MVGRRCRSLQAPDRRGSKSDPGDSGRDRENGLSGPAGFSRLREKGPSRERPEKGRQCQGPGGNRFSRQAFGRWISETSRIWVPAIALIAALASQPGCRTVYLPEDAAYYRAKWEEALKRAQDCEASLDECKDLGTAETN